MLRFVVCPPPSHCHTFFSLLCFTLSFKVMLPNVQRPPTRSRSSARTPSRPGKPWPPSGSASTPKSRRSVLQGAGRSRLPLHGVAQVKESSAAAKEQVEDLTQSGRNAAQTLAKDVTQLEGQVEVQEQQEASGRESCWGC